MFYPSNDQKAILNYILSQIKNNKLSKADVIAPAGSGKSTTIMYLLDQLSQSYKFVYLVFNSDMKKELEQRLSFSVNSFQMINKENVSTYTFHGYLRKVLAEKIPDIGFDYKNGSISQVHIQKLLSLSGIYSSESSARYELVADSFNKYIKDFVKTTLTKESFMSNSKRTPDFGINELNALTPLINKKYNISTSSLGDLTIKEKKDVVKAVYDDFIDDIFEGGLLNDNLPHDIYYKYVHYKYKELDLFSEYPFVVIDEAQDIDPIIISLLDRSKSSIIKFGDNFQQINRFRGTVNSLEDKVNKQFSLTYSYRLSPYLAFLTEGFLKQEAQKLGYESDDVPTIYGVAQNGLTIKESGFTIGSTNDFFKKIINELSNVDIENSDSFLAIKENRDKIEKAVLSGKKSYFKKSVTTFLKKNKDPVSFYRDILNFTSLFAEKTSSQIEQELMSLDEGDNQELLRELYCIAKDYSLKLSKKEKREILVTENGTFGLLARNNKEVISGFYDFVKFVSTNIKSASTNNVQEIPRFNVRFSLAMASTYDMFSKHKFSSIAPKDKAIMINTLKQIPSKMSNNNISVWDIYSKLASIVIPEKIIAKLINDIDSAKRLVNMKISSSLSLKDFGAKEADIKDIIKDMLKVAKTKSKKEISELSIREIMDLSGITNISKLIPFECLLESQLDIEALSKENKFNMITNFYKYVMGKKIANNNDDIELVNDGAFYNIYFSTAHKAKGLELDNVFIAKDIYNIDDLKDIKEKRDEFKLGYVAITRTKRELMLENESPLIEVLNEVKNNDYQRFYKSKNVLLKEGLAYCDNAPNPYYELSYKNDMKIKLDSVITILSPSSIMKPYNKMCIEYNHRSGEASLIDDKTHLNNENSEYIKPISEKEYNDTKELYNQEMKEIINNAPF